MWGSLKNQKERKEILEILDIPGAGTTGFSGDYCAVFVKRSKEADFFLVKYGVRTIYVSNPDEPWHDVYNWNIHLFARDKPDGDIEEVDRNGFLTYDEGLDTIKLYISEYPDKYFRPELYEVEDVELGESERFIVSSALSELTKDNLKEVKNRITGTVLGVNTKHLDKAYELLDMKHDLLIKNKF